MFEFAEEELLDRSGMKAIIGGTKLIAGSCSNSCEGPAGSIGCYSNESGTDCLCTLRANNDQC